MKKGSIALYCIKSQVCSPILSVLAMAPNSRRISIIVTVSSLILGEILNTVL